ncbi:MAG: adenylate kinase family protein [Candidatus Saccharimonadia bacterium]
MAAEVIIIVGPQGSGKGTQAEILANRLHGLHLSTGQMFRERKDKVVLDQIDNGKLAPSENFREVVSAALRASDPNQIIVLDGVARKLPEAQWLFSLLGQLGRKLSYVIILEIPRSESVARLLRREGSEHRADDNEIGINNRLDYFEKETLPVIEFWNSLGVTRVVDGLGSINEVTQRINRIIK